MKDLLMITHFTAAPDEAGNSRFTYLAQMLSEIGFSVEIVTSSFSHRSKKQREPCDDKEIELNYEFSMLYEPGYAKNVSIARFYSHWVFGKSLRRYLQKRRKPDIIYCSVPSLDAAYQAAVYAQQNHIRFIVDIQDLWPEAFRMVFNLPVISDFLFLPMTRLADRIYSVADGIVAVSQTYADRALEVSRKCEEATVAFLGTDLSYFDELKRENHVQKPEGELWLGYVGSLGNSYDLTTVIDALCVLGKQGIDNLRLIVMGDGVFYSKFKSYAHEKGIKSTFTGRLPYPSMVGMLCACDLAVNPIMPGSAGSIINKVGDYAAAGLPVINTQECQEYRDLIDEYQCGINCGCSNVDDVVVALDKLLTSEDERVFMGANARRLAEDRFNRGATYQAIVELINRAAE